MAIVPQNAQVPMTQKPKKGSGFTNLQSILEANKGNKLGGAVVGGVQGAGQQAQSTLQAGQKEFEAGLSGARGQRQEKEQTSKGILSRFGQQDYAGQDIGEQEVGKVEELRSSKYAGPQGLTNEQMVQQQAKQAEQLGQYAGSAGGRQELLRRFVGGVPQYSQRKQMQDELLLGLGGGEQALKQAGKATRGLQARTAEEIQKAKFAGSDEARQLEAAKSAQEKALQDLYSGVDTSIEQKRKSLMDTEAQRQSQRDLFRTMMGREGVDAALNYAKANQLLGEGDVESLRALQGLDVGDPRLNVGGAALGELQGLIDLGMKDTSRGAAASAQERGKLDALARLKKQAEEFKGFKGPQDRAAGVSREGIRTAAQRMLGDITPREQELLSAQTGARAREKEVSSALGQKVSQRLSGLFGFKEGADLNRGKQQIDQQLQAELNKPPINRNQNTIQMLQQQKQNMEEYDRLSKLAKTSPGEVIQHLKATGRGSDTLIDEDLAKLQEARGAIDTQGQRELKFRQKKDALQNILNRYA